MRLPDGFYEAANRTLYLCWENDREVTFARLPLTAFA